MNRYRLVCAWHDGDYVIISPWTRTFEQALDVVILLLQGEAGWASPAPWTYTLVEANA